MTEATRTQQTAIAEMSQRLFGVPARAVLIAAEFMPLQRGMSIDQAKVISAALFEAGRRGTSPIARETYFRDELKKATGREGGIGVSVAENWKKEHMTTAEKKGESSRPGGPVKAANARDNGRVLGPDGDKPWRQWAFEQLGLKSESIERDCPRCHGTGKVVRRPPGTKAFPVSEISGALFGYKTGLTGKSTLLTDPLLSRVRHVASLLGSTLEEASVWIEQLRGAIEAERAAR